jgi:thioredoxin 1
MSKHNTRAAGADVPSSRESGTLPSPRPARRLWRAGVPLLLAATVIAVFAVRPRRELVSLAPAPAPMVSHGSMAVAGGIPRLVDLGADKCIPCKAMAPILVELRAEYAGRMQVVFIDVWKDPSAGDPYNIYAIPTQIFFDGNGKELTRHEGFISKADILATWKRFGYDFSSPGAPAPRS